MKSSRSKLGPPAKSKTFVSKAKAAEMKKKAEDEKLRKAEEERIAAEKAEEEKLKSPKFANDKERINDLKEWLRSTPIPEYELKRLDRTFSDGSLVAEVVHHFNPSLCNTRPYFKWYSSKNKRTNWETLNFKVFPKMGFKLNQKQINHIVKPFESANYKPDSTKGLYIYRLLTKVRDKLGEKNPAVFEYRRNQNANESISEMAVRKPKPEAKRKLRNYLEDPFYSRVEMLLEKGFYDKECEEVYDGGPFTTSVDCWPLVDDLQRNVEIQQAGSCLSL